MTLQELIDTLTKIRDEYNKNHKHGNEGKDPEKQKKGENLIVRLSNNINEPQPNLFLAFESYHWKYKEFVSIEYMSPQDVHWIITDKE